MQNYSSDANQFYDASFRAQDDILNWVNYKTILQNKNILYAHSLGPLFIKRKIEIYTKYSKII